MYPIEPLPAQDQLRVAVIPDLIMDGERGMAFTVPLSVLADIRDRQHIPLIVPAHDANGLINAAAHAYIRWSFDMIHASEHVKAELDSDKQLWAVKDYAERLIDARHDIAEAINGNYQHPSDIDIGDHFNPRVLVVPDLKNGIVRLSQRFIDALRQGAKVIPVIASGAEQLESELDHAAASGILLPGSNSHFHPQHYDGKEEAIEPNYDLARDALVKAAVLKAYNDDIPLFGICSGMQGIVVFGDEGGRLIPDLHEAERPGHHAAGRQTTREVFQEATTVLIAPRGSARAFKKKTLNFAAAHRIKLQPGSFLTHLLNVTLKFSMANQDNIAAGFDIPVNSLHQQAIDETSIGKSLSIEAVADDGTIEAVHSRHHHYIVGVQFHPEAAFMKDAPPQAPLETALYRALFWSFGQAASDKAWSKQIARRGRGGNWRNRGMAWIYMGVPGTMRMTPEFVTGGGFSGTSYNLLPKLWD